MKYIPTFEKFINEKSLLLNEDLDPILDNEFIESQLNMMERSYEDIKPKRMDSSKIKQDMLDILANKKIADKDKFDKFLEMYPTTTSHSAWRGLTNDFRQYVRNLLKHDKAIKAGDTSSYGYRVHARR
jgi:hypothetical protein